MIFKVNGNIWQVVNVLPYDRNLKTSNGHTLGVCDNNDKTIYMDVMLSTDKYNHVLTHEIVHVFCFEYGLNFPTSIEEKIANFIADYGREIIEVVDYLVRIEVKYA